MKKSKVWIFFLSLIVTIAICFIPEIGNAKMDGYHAYGFPADLIHVHDISGDYSFVSLGPIFNVVFFYVVFLLIYKTIMKLKKTKMSF